MTGKPQSIIPNHVFQPCIQPQHAAVFSNNTLIIGWAYFQTHPNRNHEVYHMFTHKVYMHLCPCHSHSHKDEGHLLYLLPGSTSCSLEKCFTSVWQLTLSIMTSPVGNGPRHQSLWILSMTHRLQQLPWHCLIYTYADKSCVEFRREALLSFWVKKWRMGQYMRTAVSVLKMSKIHYHVYFNFDQKQDNLADNFKIVTFLMFTDVICTVTSSYRIGIHGSEFCDPFELAHELQIWCLSV